MNSSIEVRGAHKSYGKGENKNLILKGLNMSVKMGQIYSLIGASGCGKTTLLQCVLGMKQLEGGTIKVLGSEKVNKVSHLIGYMPQTHSLVPELTIKETLYYFGNIFQMNFEIMQERYKMLHDLLELPPSNRKVEKLSGGQMRRVSLAASLIHNPLILILDEPTVGLDSLLREKIWKFLIATTSTTNLSVVITTHYISEASNANCVGMMRDGRLLTEDTPKNIMCRLETESLDSAFLRLCLLKSNSEDRIDAPIEMIEEPNQPENVVEMENLRPRKKFCRETFSALLTKECLRVRRQPSEFIFITILPILQILIFGFGIGKHPKGLQIGIVNHEASNFTNNFCPSFLQNQSHGVASCDFLTEITDEIALKIPFESHAEAYQAVKHGKIWGFLELADNFTDIMSLSKSSKKKRNQFFSSALDVHMDKSDLQITSFLEYRLLKAYESFNGKLLRRFKLNENLEHSPVKFEKPIYGSLMSDFRNTMAPPTILNIAFFNSLGFSCFSIAQNRLGGFWNRTILAGVTPFEILFVQIITGFVAVFVSLAEVMLLAFYVIDITIIGSLFAIFVILFLVCASGAFCGILVSTIADDIKIVSMFTLAFGQIVMNICGVSWPLEGMPWIVRYISYTTPITLPSISLRDIMLKGFSISAPTVMIGIYILLAWISLTLILSFFVLKKRKFSEKSL